MAQEKTAPAELKYKNSINTYIGLIELNINYERNIMQRPHSYTNVRAGYGYWTEFLKTIPALELSYTLSDNEII